MKKIIIFSIVVGLCIGIMPHALIDLSYGSLTVQEQIEQLVSTVISLNLQQGISSSLDAKLESALQALDDTNENNDIAAINSLNAFINAVEAQRGNKIPNVDADTLITEAEIIITNLESPSTITVRFYAGTGDGYVTHNTGTNTSWATAHDSIDGTNVQDDMMDSEARSNYYSPHNRYYLMRAFFPFDTSSLPDDNITITNATLNIYVFHKVNHDNDGDDFEVVVEGLQASPLGLTVDDYDECGDAITNPTEGSNRIDIDNITLESYNTFILNNTGKSWISTNGWTMLGMREGHDVLNHQLTTGSGYHNNSIVFYSAESGTSTAPYLEVTYQQP